MIIKRTELTAEQIEEKRRLAILEEEQRLKDEEDYKRRESEFEEKRRLEILEAEKWQEEEAARIKKDASDLINLRKKVPALEKELAEVRAKFAKDLEAAKALAREYKKKFEIESANVGDLGYNITMLQLTIQTNAEKCNKKIAEIRAEKGWWVRTFGN